MMHVCGFDALRHTQRLPVNWSVMDRVKRLIKKRFTISEQQEEGRDKEKREINSNVCEDGEQGNKEAEEKKLN